MTYAIVWEFQVPPDHAAEFEAAYSPCGPWAQLFEQAEGFLGVELLCCTDRTGRYLTIDRWQSRSAFEAFRSRFAAEYEALDKRLEGLAVTETRIGAFAARLDGDGAK